MPERIQQWHREHRRLGSKSTHPPGTPGVVNSRTCFCLKNKKWDENFIERHYYKYLIESTNKNSLVKVFKKEKKIRNVLLAGHLRHEVGVRLRYLRSNQKVINHLLHRRWLS